MPGKRQVVLGLAGFLLLSTQVVFAEKLSGQVSQTETGGQMTVLTSAGNPAPDIMEELTFSPWDIIDDLDRDDVVLLMRHGPTDWSKRDAVDVAPTDCANQRIMTEIGKRQMYELGALLVANDLRPGQIVVSEWCRNQETLEAMVAGMTAGETAILDGVEINTMSELNLLLSLRGVPSVSAMRDFISSWDGGDGDGPLLIISHFTNIQELTERSVFEGEMLLLDPSQDNRVLGDLKLGSAAPDVGHFQ